LESLAGKGGESGSLTPISTFSDVMSRGAKNNAIPLFVASPRERGNAILGCPRHRRKAKSKETKLDVFYDVPTRTINPGVKKTPTIRGIQKRPVERECGFVRCGQLEVGKGVKLTLRGKFHLRNSSPIIRKNRGLSVPGVQGGSCHWREVQKGGRRYVLELTTGREM